MTEKEEFSKEELKRRLEGNELDLSLCSIVKVPVKQISNLSMVKVLDLSCNKISEIPDSFCDLRNLTQIDLSKNCLVCLPSNFGNLNNLKRLDLYSNNLVSLPLSFSELKKLKWLDLKDNPVQTDLFDIVGDCLDPKDCESCAMKMLDFMQTMKAEDNKRKAREAEMERKRRIKEESELQQQNELRKREKKIEKEKRRQAYLENQQNKPETTTNENNGNYANENQDSNKSKFYEPKTNKKTMSLFMPFIKVFCVGVIAALIIYFCRHFMIPEEGN